MPYSTKVNSQYFRANFENTVTYDVITNIGTLESFTELDPLSESLHDFVDSLSRFIIKRWTGQQFTTMVYEVYGNTTLIWLVLMCNGMVSRTELRRGMLVRFPYLEDIQAYMTQQAVTAKATNSVVLI